MLLWRRKLILAVLLVTIDCESILNATNQCPNVKTTLNSIRKRRHLTFPDGTNFVMTIALVKAYMVHAPSGWNLSIETDVNFPVPDANFTNAHSRRKLHSRQKREFWKRLESAIYSHNLNGRSCLLRSVCEAKTWLAPPGKSLVHDILRTVFAVPANTEDFNESYEELLDEKFCDQAPPDCPFSFIHFVLSLNKQIYY